MTVGGWRAGLAVIAMAAASPARAQDALHGKRLYLDAARITGSGVSCVDCHGGLPGGLYGIGRAADDPALVETAVDTVSQMAPLRGRLAGADLADLAAYIGDPGVPSPQVELATWRPGGEPGLADRIELGEVTIGAASDAATLELRNTGQLAFAITGAPEVAGTDAGDFAIESADCDAGSLVAPGASCRFALVFGPSAVGARAARFLVPHDWVHGVAAVALLGSAAPAASSPPSPSPSPSSPLSSPGCSSTGGHAWWPVIGWLACRRRRRRPGDQVSPYDGCARANRDLATNDLLRPCRQRRFYALAPDRHGRLALGMINGAGLFNGTSFRRLDEGDGTPHGATVFTITTDPSDRLWAGTPRGLHVRGPAGWRSLAKRDGLPNPGVTQVRHAGGGPSGDAVYVATQGGLVVLDPDTLQVRATIDVRDGLGGDNVYVTHRDPDQDAAAAARRSRSDDSRGGPAQRAGGARERSRPPADRQRARGTAPAVAILRGRSFDFERSFGFERSVRRTRIVIPSTSPRAYPARPLLLLPGCILDWLLACPSRWDSRPPRGPASPGTAR